MFALMVLGLIVLVLYTIYIRYLHYDFLEDLDDWFYEKRQSPDEYQFNGAFTISYIDSLEGTYKFLKSRASFWKRFFMPVRYNQRLIGNAITMDDMFGTALSFQYYRVIK